jgi:hypothetical protein
MFSLSRKVLAFAAASSLALVTPAMAGEVVQRLQPSVASMS